jgi:hypothetical protein
MAIGICPYCPSILIDHPLDRYIEREILVLNLLLLKDFGRAFPTESKYEIKWLKWGYQHY